MGKEESGNNLQSNKIDKSNFELTEDTKLALEEFSLNLNKTIKEFNTTMGSVMQDVLPKIQLMINNILEPVKDFDWKRFSELISKLDVNGIYFNAYKSVIEENQRLIQLFYNDTIFPPLHYIIHKQVESEEIQMPLNMWIQSENIKLYYLDRINEWKNKYKNKNVHKIIDEVYYNFNENNYYSVTFLINTLLEYLFNDDYISNKSKVGRYAQIRKALKENVFDYIEFEGLDDKFIDKNLYCDTNKAQEFSRHTIHGTGLDMINYKTTLTIIFFYDFIQDILKVSEEK